MFTQKISMDCTREQYEKYLKEELIKIGYDITGAWGWSSLEVNTFMNNYNGINGSAGAIVDNDRDTNKCTYLGSFNPDLFLALAAMTDKDTSEYGEWLIGNRGEYVRNNFGESWINFSYWRKATIDEIMEKFGKQESDSSEDMLQKLQEAVNLYMKKIEDALNKINDIPQYKEPVIGEMAIFWDSNKAQSICRLYIKVRNDKYVDFCGTSWENAILFESPEQYKNFLKEQ